MFLYGFLVGTVVTSIVVAWLFWRVIDGRTEQVVLDRWWMENADRWEWVRTYEMEKAGSEHEK